MTQNVTEGENLAEMRPGRIRIAYHSVGVCCAQMGGSDGRKFLKKLAPSCCSCDNLNQGIEVPIVIGCIKSSTDPTFFAAIAPASAVLTVDRKKETKIHRPENTTLLGKESHSP